MTQGLPMELVGQIIGHIESIRHTCPLLLVSRAFFTEAERRLYRDVVFTTASRRWPLLHQSDGLGRIAPYVSSLRITVDQNDWNDVMVQICRGVVMCSREF